MEEYVEGQNAISDQLEQKNIGNEVPQICPFTRFCARGIDIMLFAFLVGVFISFTDPTILNIDYGVLGIIILFFWVFVETILLSTWGTTPGKYLLNITLRDSNGEKLSFSKALKRSFFVWFIGLGLGLITLITLIMACNTLEKNGKTTWDRYGGYIVSHKKVGMLRVLITIFLFVGFIVLSLY